MKNSTLKRDIKEEEQGEEHYESMAKKHPRQRKMYNKMARDESRHEHNLEKLAKTKALKNKTK